MRVRVSSNQGWTRGPIHAKPGSEMQALLILGVALVGTLLPLQAGLNAALRGYLGHPLLGAYANFVVGFVLLTLVGLVLRVPLPSSQALATPPLWYWSGGLIGASLVVIGVFAAPKLGAALLIAALVAGQLCSSVLVDHFGLVGYPVRPLSLERILGVTLLFVGVYLIQRGR